MGLVELFSFFITHKNREKKNTRAAKRENERKNMCAGESSLFS